MKNISRRVFIKGMAVAAAATAASTVLAGCNLTPEVEEVPAPSTNNVLSYVDADDEEKKLTITATKLTKADGIFTKDQAAISLKFDNRMGAALSVLTSKDDVVTGNANIGANNYYVQVSAYQNGRTGEKMSFVESPILYVNTGTKYTNKVTNDDVTLGDLYLTVKDDTKKLTLKVELMKVLDQANKIVKPMASEEFSYDL